MWTMSRPTMQRTMSGYLLICLIFASVLWTHARTTENLRSDKISSDGTLIETLQMTADGGSKSNDRKALRSLESFHRQLRSDKKSADSGSDLSADAGLVSGRPNHVVVQLSAVSKSEARTLRKDIFDHYEPASHPGEVRLAGSLIPYMGRIQVALPGNRWGAVCATGWDVIDALVVCRQLGFKTGGVVVRKGADFGGSFGPTVLTEVDCVGHETSLDECKAEPWNGFNSLQCGEMAGVICGCPFNKDPNVISRCSFDTSFPQDKMYCRYSCKDGLILTGSSLRRCDATQTWSGNTPKCVVARKACDRNPCLNGGKCRGSTETDTKYTCTCKSQFTGERCQTKLPWKCGKPTSPGDLSTVRPQLRIVGGREAVESSWPWIVQLRDKEDVFCGGSIVSPKWVITAAHCLKMKKINTGPNSDTRWTVLAGQHRRQGRERGSLELQITYFILHGYSNVDIPRKDLAMIRLQSEIHFSRLIGPICLPTSRWDNPSPGSKCWIVGWGSYTLSNQLPTVLQQGDIPILSNDRCKKIKSGSFRDYSAIEANMICAGYFTGGVDACKGDSGGPLMCQRSDGSFYLSGVTSWGYGCAEANVPGIYTRVSHYLDWINRYLPM